MSAVSNIVIISLALMFSIAVLFYVFVLDRKESIINVTVKNITPLSFDLKASNGNIQTLAPNASYNVTLNYDGAWIKAETIFPEGVDEKFEAHLKKLSRQQLYLTLDGFKSKVFNVELANTSANSVIFAYVAKRGQRRFPVAQLNPNETMPDVPVPQGSNWQVSAEDETPLAEVKIDKPITKMGFNGSQIIVA